MALEIYRGDDCVLNLTVMKGEVPADLTGCAVTFTARHFANAQSVVFSKDTLDGIEIDPDPTTGRATIAVDAADTGDLPRKTALAYDVQVVDSESFTHTIAAGTLTVLADVTRTLETS